MWRRYFINSYSFACLVAVALIVTCCCVQAALGNRLEELSVKMQDSAGNGWSGAIIAQTETEYLIATCSHGAQRGAVVSAQPYGCRLAIRCRTVWTNHPQTLDLALFACPKVIKLKTPDSVAPRPAMGEYLRGWGYPARTGRRLTAFGGRVVSQGAWTGQRPPNGIGPYDDINCATSSGDSGSVLWTTDGIPAGVQWGSSAATTTYTPLVYAQTCLQKQSQVRFLQRPGCQQCPQPFQPPNRPAGPPRVQPPPPDLAEAPVPAEPLEAPEPPCCNELRQGLEKTNGYIGELREAQAATQKAITAIDLLLAQMKDERVETDLSDYATKDDLSAMEGRLVDLISTKVEARFQQIDAQFQALQPKNPIAHLVVIAEQGASYWPRLAGNIDRAKDVFHQIEVAPPDPNKQLGQLPILVEYQDSTPVAMWRGEREVSQVLGDVARGRWKDSTKD